MRFLLENAVLYPTVESVSKTVVTMRLLKRDMLPYEGTDVPTERPSMPKKEFSKQDPGGQRVITAGTPSCHDSRPHGHCCYNR